MANDKILGYDDYATAERSGLTIPHIIEVANGPQKLTFYGTDHTNDPTNNQFADIEERWQSFKANATSPEVFVEGYADSWQEEAATDRQQSIVNGGEAVFMVHLARRDGVPVVSPEPDPTELSSTLAEEFGRDNVALYDFLVHLSWQMLTSETAKNEANIHKILNNLKNARKWDDVDFSAINMKALYRQVANKSLDIHDQQGINDSITPAKLDTVLNAISRRSGDLRDEMLLAQLETSWAEGKSPFVVYGAAHAIRLEKALRSLTAE